MNQSGLNSVPAFDERPPPAWSRSVRAVAFEVVVFVLLAMTLVNYPSLPGVDLDPSWRQVLGYAALEGLQFGRDIVFTYGPLGYLLTPANSGEFIELHWSLQLISASLYAAVILAFSRNFDGVARGAVLTYFLVLVGPYGEALFLQVLFLALLAYARFGLARSGGWAVLVAALLAVASLAKFTHLMVAAAVLPILCAQAVLTGRPRTAGILLAGFLGFLLGGWVLAGQSLGALPAYLSGAMELSGGYTRNMGLRADGWVLACGLLSIAGVTFYAGQRWWGSTNRLRDAAVVLVAAVGAFLHWKHGFVRADGHTLSHFSFQLFLVIILPVVLTGRAALPRTGRMVLTGVALLCLLGWWRAAPASINEALMQWNYRLRDTKDRLTHSGRWYGETLNQINHVRNLYALPEVQEIVGDASVDILGHEQGFAIFNQLNYTPRPAFQGYFATTPGLMGRNAAFFEGPSRPAFVLQKLQTIDQRLPAQDDALATLAVYQRYTLLGQHRRFLLWQRQDDAPAPAAPALIATRAATWGEQIVVPDADGDPVWCEIDLSLSWRGRVANLLAKPQELRIHVTDTEDFTMGYRYLATAGRIGFLVAPHFVSNHDLARYQTTPASRRLDSFELRPARSVRPHDYPGSFTVRFLRLAPFTRNPAVTVEDTSAVFRSFSHLPVRHEALYAMAELSETEGVPLVAAHPPSVIEFQRPADARYLSGHFGFFQGALAEKEKTDGVGFRIEWQDASGRLTILRETYLDPNRRAADGQLQHFSVELPPGPGLIRLHTTPGPAHDLSFDWVYWRDVAFQPGPTTAAP